MEKEKELERRRKKNLILFYKHCKYGIKAFLPKEACEKLEREIKRYEDEEKLTK